MRRDTLKYADEKGLKVFAKTIINHVDSHVHNIKHIVISKQEDFYAVVNSKTLIIQRFSTEEEALNHVLDYYRSLDITVNELFK